MNTPILTKSSDIPKIRKELLDNQNNICPISKIILTEQTGVVDHKHKKYKDQLLGEDGIGCIRGVLDRYCNAWEGKVTNSFNRLGLHKYDLSISDMLRNLADYLEQEPTNYIHPTEVPKEPNLKKSSYNKLLKVLKEAGHSKKIPEYPKSKKLTQGLQKLFEEYNVDIEYY